MDCMDLPSPRRTPFPQCRRTGLGCGSRRRPHRSRVRLFQVGSWAKISGFKCAGRTTGLANQSGAPSRERILFTTVRIKTPVMVLENPLRHSTDVRNAPHRRFKDRGRCSDVRLYFPCEPSLENRCNVYQIRMLRRRPSLPEAGYRYGQDSGSGN